MGQYKCKILHQKEITDGVYTMSLDAAVIVRESHPGQFVHLRVGQGLDPLLRRPFSIHRLDRRKGEINLLYRVVGGGTEFMRRAEKGHVLDLMGPLGSGFKLDKTFSQAIIVAGGMGIAPVFFLIDELVAMGKHVTLLWGVKKGEEIFKLSALKKLGVQVEVVTENGSLGHQGVVTDLLERFLSDRPLDPDFEGFVCGPKAMLKQVQRMTGDIPFDWQVSLEERMACGVGVCMGCAVKLQQGGYKMVCSDGPAFDLKEIVFDG